MIEYLRRLGWTLRSLFPGKVRSDSGKLGSLKEQSAFGRLVRHYWWALPIIAALIALAVVFVPKIHIPTIQMKSKDQIVVSTSPQQVAPTQQDLVVIDSCHIVDQRTGRKYVAEDCLTFAQKVQAIARANPIASILFLIVWAAVWFMVGRVYERRKK